MTTGVRATAWRWPGPGRTARARRPCRPRSASARCRWPAGRLPVRGRDGRRSRRHAHADRLDGERRPRPGAGRGGRGGGRRRAGVDALAGRVAMSLHLSMIRGPRRFQLRRRLACAGARAAGRQPQGDADRRRPSTCLAVRALASDAEARRGARPSTAATRTELGRARRERVDLVIVLGGDGTVNEVVNGAGPELAVPEGRLTARAPAAWPLIGVVPGGGTNVLARALGLPLDPVEATGAIRDALRAGRRRTIGLGLADDRYFTFSAGPGLDAEVVRAVERRRAQGRRDERAAVPARRWCASSSPAPTGAGRADAGARPGEPPVERSVPGHRRQPLAVDLPRQPPAAARSRPDFDSGLDLLALQRLAADHGLERGRPDAVRPAAARHAGGTCVSVWARNPSRCVRPGRSRCRSTGTTSARPRR